MHLIDRINSGMLFYEHGHTDPVDIEQEKQLQEERDHCKEVMFEYNNTHPREDEQRQAIMKSILGSCGDHFFFVIVKNCGLASIITSNCTDNGQISSKTLPPGEGGRAKRGRKRNGEI